MGIKCGHESIFDYSSDNIIKNRLFNKNERVISRISTRNGGWIDEKEIEADSSYLAAPYLDWPELENTKIIHVFRNPIDVISSFSIDFGYFAKKEPNAANPFNELGFEQKIWRFLPGLSEIESNLERVCYFYYQWNKLIEEKSKNKQVLKIKIEDDKKNEKIAEFLNININNINLFNNQKENSFSSGNKIKLSEIPNGEIKDNFIKMIKEMNYKVGSLVGLI